MPKLTLSFKGHVIDVYHIEKGEVLIGRDSDCVVNIDSLAVAPLHARITQQGDACEIESLNDEFPTVVNHNQVDNTHLHHGDIIQVGKHELSFSEDVMDLNSNLASPQQPQNNGNKHDEEPAPTNAIGMLQIMSGDNFGRIIPLKRNMTRIGHAGDDCAIIARRDSGYFISHLEGDNTPVINDQPIDNNSVQLSDGDTIEVGTTQMQFHSKIFHHE